MIHLGRLHINVSDLIVEIVSIVIAILLALTVNNWQQHLKDRALLRESLVNIRQEIQANNAALQQEMRHHLAVAAGFDKLVADNLQTERISSKQVRAAFIQSSPTGFHTVHGSSTAWQIAESSHAVELMPYSERVTLTKLYSEQATHELAEQKVFDLFASPTPSSGNNFFYATVGLSLVLGDVVGYEGYLARDYAASLAQLNKV